MNKLFILFSFVGSFLSYNANLATLNGKWRLIKYYGLTAGTSQSEPTNISRSIVVTFSDDGQQVKINGETVTNTGSGEYEILKGDKMKTISFGGTKVAEPGWGKKFWDAIRAASSFKRKGDKLFIFFNSEKEKMEF